MLKIEKRLTENEDTYKFYDIDIILNDAKIGYAELFVMNGEYNYIKSIEIKKEHRNKGYGSKVLTDLAAELDGLYICPDNNDAERLYTRLGDKTNAPECLESETDEYGVMYYIG